MNTVRLDITSRGFRVVTAVGAMAFAVALTACPKKKPKGIKLPPSKRPPVKIAVFTESSPVTAVTALGNNLWVGTHNGLVRWELATGHSRILTQDEGLPADRILALASDARNGLWVATSRGIVRHRSGRWRQFGDCPLGEDVDALAPTSDGRGVWIGGAKGLARYLFGRWNMVRRRLSVTALLPAAHKDAVWVGTMGSGVLLCTARRCKKYGAKHGLKFKRVSKLSYGMKALLAVGSTDKGDRLGAYLDKKWYTYRPKPNVLLQWVSFAMGKTFLAAGGHVHRLDLGKVKRKPGDLKPVMKLTGPSKGPKYTVTRLKFPLPSNVTQVAGALGYLWIGTQSLGVTRFDGKRYLHYRTKDLSRGARYLSVACAGQIDTYVANGRAAYKFDGSVWSRVQKVTNEIGEEVQYFLNDPKGKAVAVYRIQGGELKVATLHDEVWKPWTLQQPIKGPGPLTASSAAFDARGRLWIGIGYLDRDGEAQSYGAVTVDPSAGTVVYHRNFQGRGKPQEGSLSLPNDVTAIASDGPDVWMGSTSGACRIKPGNRVKCFTEASGLSSTFVRGIVKGPGYTLWFATVEGVSTYNGKRFKARQEEGLDKRSRGIAVTRGGRVWVGTNEGLVLYVRGATFTYDEDVGMLENKVLHLLSDRRGRVWAQHPGGISLVTP